LAQGTYCHIVFIAEKEQYKKAVEDIKGILDRVDKSVSLWEENSIINRVNDNVFPQKLDSIFINCFLKSQEISALTNGYLDCTIGILSQKYGFNNKDRENISQKTLDSLLQYVGYDKVSLSENNEIIKKYPQMRIDFNAIAQGYTTDLIAEYFINNKIDNFIVDIGGEVRARGRKKNKKLWTCAIEKPAKDSEDAIKYDVFLELDNQSIVTSGNYRKYYIDENGQRKAHTIDPFAGKSVTHTLLSASVIAENATMADGLATAFMAMGKEKTIDFLKTHPKNIEVYLIYWENNQIKTYYTQGLKDKIKKVN
jgi:thiamine biosynthesis lipoprotein